jgi:hypothetical protein
VNSLQFNPLEDSSVSKWKRIQNKELFNSGETQQEPIATVLTDDQQLTQYQLTRKKAEHELVALEKIKRPSPEERDKMARVEREIYHLDSDIAGLKRKIRRKY